MNLENQELAHTFNLIDVRSAVSPLLPNQIEGVCQSLAAETDPSKQRLYWNLLQQSPPSSRPLDFALQSILTRVRPTAAKPFAICASVFPTAYQACSKPSPAIPTKKCAISFPSSCVTLIRKPRSA